MNAPSVIEFKAQFARDFPYGNNSTAVMNSDITNGIRCASFLINEALFDTEDNYKFAYNYLAAHFLVTSLKQSSQGLSSSYSWNENSKSVGSVSQSFTIPDSILQNPLFAGIAKTYYGAFYLSIVIPKTYGGMAPIGGATLA